MDTNKQIIHRCLAETLECSEAEIEAMGETVSLHDAGMDSIRFIQFIVSVEDAFQIEVRDSDLLMERFGTLQAVYKTLAEYIQPPVLKKVLVLDCDNVLWRGIAGEEEIVIDADTVAFHQRLLRLYDKGVLLCLCSRNEEQFVKEAFANPAMRLKEHHIAASLVNHQSKADNLRELATELNLSTDSFVFVDDSVYELGAVESLLPEVTCVKAWDGEWLEVVENFFAAVQSDGPNRTELYRQQKEREKSKHRFATVEEYNRSLQTVFTCEVATPEQLPRLAELSRRTNQFNLADTHYTEEQLATRLNDPTYTILTLSVTDIYGDMGLVGMAVLHGDEIEDFMLSCRVFDRGFELVLLNAIKETAGVPLYGVYRPTEKNARHKDFYIQNGVTVR